MPLCCVLPQRDVFYLDGFVQEELGLVAENVGVFGGQVVGGSALRALGLQLGMAGKVVLEGAGHVLALRHDAHGGGHVLEDFGHEQGVVGAAEDDGIDVGVLAHELVDALLDEVVGSGRVGFVGLYDGCPKGTGHS